MYVCFSSAVYGRQWCGRLEDSHDVWADLLHRAGAAGVCHPSHPGPVRLHLDSAAGLHLHAVGGRCWRGHHPLHPHVPETLPDRQGHVAPQQAVHWRFVSQHRRAQQDQLQHTLCHEDSHDHLSRNCSTGVQHILLDHCCMDCARLWEVNTGLWIMDVCWGQIEKQNKMAGAQITHCGLIDTFIPSLFLSLFCPELFTVVFSRSSTLECVESWE